jgi:hypothetical protein
MSYKINFSGCQQIAHTSGGSVASSAIPARDVVVYSTTDCFLNVGASSVTAGATGAGNMFIPAQTFVELRIVGTGAKYMAARSSSTSGTLYINPLTRDKND